MRILTTGKDAAVQRPQNVLGRLLARISKRVQVSLSTCRSSIQEERGCFPISSFIFHHNLPADLEFFVLSSKFLLHCVPLVLWHWPKDSSFNIALSQNLTLFKGPFPLPTFSRCIQKKGLISWLFDCCCCCPLSGHAVPRPEDA